MNTSDGGHHTSLVPWGKALDGWDEFAPALAVFNEAGAPGSTRHERARLSLALGRPRQGLNILDEDRTGSHAGRSAADEALRAALRAALGDHDAYAWLRSQVVRDTGSAPIGYLRWLLAVAAEAAGDRPAADELWVSLVERSHLLTWHSTARYTLVSGWERGAHRDFFHVPLASIGKQARSGTVGPKRTTTMRATGPSAAIGDLTERARSQD